MAMTQEEILQSIKEKILCVVPDASILLFGSRARGDWHEESDWDVLVLTNEKVDYKLKEKVQNSVFTTGLAIGSFIHTILINEEQWMQNPAWYSLSATIQEETIKL